MSFKKKVALFDFDGTLTDRDTLFDFLKFYKGTFSLYLGLFFLTPVFGLFFFRILSNERAKELMLTWFLKNNPIDTFNEACNKYALQRVPAILREQALLEINTCKRENIKVVVVTASPENWVKPWCESMGISCIGTKLQVQNLLITGKIEGKNCYGDEKVNRIKNEYNLNDYLIESAYGDSSGDLPMLNLAEKRFFKPFRS